MYLPAGTWYDWWTGCVYSGPIHILADAPLERMPLYVRAGAIIPMQPVMQYVDERPIDQLRLRIFPGTGEYTIYEDDGHTFEYQQKYFSTTVLRVFTNAIQTIVEIEAREGEWTPAPREVIVELVGIGEQRSEPSSISSIHGLKIPPTHATPLKAGNP